MESSPTDDSELEPIEFQLCNGNDVRVVAGCFWESMTDTDRQQGAQPGRYWMIRVYTNEDCLKRALTLRWEFRANVEFAVESLPEIWSWLRQLLHSRTYRNYDWFEEFLGEFGEQISYFWLADEDAVEHLAHLPELSEPEAFDRVDDSQYNDHNDSLPPPERFPL